MQESMNILDGSGSELLEQLNGAFKTLASSNSGGTEPEETYGGQFWLDTSQTNKILKQRTADNTAWTTLGEIDGDGLFHPANTLASDDETVTKKGNVFNAANKLVLLDSTGKLPMLNGSLLTNLTIPTSAAKSHYIEAGSDHSKVKILADTSLEVNTSEGTKLFSATSDIEVSLPQKLDAGTPLPGKDYSLFLVPNGSGSLDFKFSLNSTAPEGYSMADVLRIGGLHTMPVSITANNASSADHAAVGYNSGEIIPVTIWDALNRPKCSPNGMGYVSLIDLWVDLYKQSGKDGAETSVFGGTRVHSRCWDDHAEDMRRCGKRLLWDYEFTEAAKGSPECVAIKGAAQPNPDTTIAYVMSNNKICISKYFLFGMVGVSWELLNNTSANGGSGWSASCGASNTKGQLYGASYALLAGGSWGNSSSCGSRSRYGSSGRGAVIADFGGRGACEPLNPRLVVS